MKFVIDFINQYGTTLLYTVLMAIISYVGLKAKKISEEYIKDKTKKEVVKTVCEAVNQLYKDLTGEEKLSKTIDNSKQILSDKGIEINDLELRMYIESVIGCFKKENNISK
jgi:hypothetical protein